MSQSASIPLNTHTTSRQPLRSYSLSAATRLTGASVELSRFSHNEVAVANDNQVEYSLNQLEPTLNHLQELSPGEQKGSLLRLIYETMNSVVNQKQFSQRYHFIKFAFSELDIEGFNSDKFVDDLYAIAQESFLKNKNNPNTLYQSINYILEKLGCSYLDVKNSNVLLIEGCASGDVAKIKSAIAMGAQFREDAGQRALKAALRFNMQTSINELAFYGIHLEQI